MAFHSIVFPVLWMLVSGYYHKFSHIQRISIIWDFSSWELSSGIARRESAQRNLIHYADTCWRLVRYISLQNILLMLIVDKILYGSYYLALTLT